MRHIEDKSNTTILDPEIGSDLDRKKGVVTVLGKGSKERRIALGQNSLRNLLYYLDKHRPDEGELVEWGSRLCCKKSWREPTGIVWFFPFNLGRHSKQRDEIHLLLWRVRTEEETPEKPLREHMWLRFVTGRPISAITTQFLCPSTGFFSL